MNLSKGVKLAVIVGLLALVYVGYKAYVSIPDATLQRVEIIKSSLDRQTTQLSQAKANLKNVEDSDNWTFLEPYAREESWSQSLVSASEDLEAAKTIYDQEITPIVDRNHKEDVDRLLKLVLKAAGLVRSSTTESRYPEERIELILESRENKEEHFATSKSLASDSQGAVEMFIRTADETATAYPEKQEDISEKVQGAQDRLEDVEAEAETIAQQYQATSTDYAVYADAFADLKKNRKSLQEYLDANRELLEQLDRTYVKVLQDQRVDYFIVIGRANWCEGEYCGNGTQMRYPATEVDEDTFEYFDTLSQDLIADRKSSWGRPSFELKVPQARWDALGVSPTYNWDSSRNYAEYWIDSMYTRTYHQYAIIEDGEVTQTDWTRVPEDTFWEHYNNLGMAIATKPKGFYESEQKTEPEPVGMAMVADPEMVDGEPKGSNEYGEWRQSGGTSFFYYYGMYRMLGDFSGANRYSYNDWNGYDSRNRGQPYYGRNNEHGTYGSSTYSNSRYRNSSFAKRNPGAMTQARTGRGAGGGTSIRGAGPSSRSLGPSGGGK